MSLTIPSMQELLEVGVHFGHQVRRGNPRMAEYIFGVRDGVHIINLEETEKLLKEAAEYAYQLGVEGKTLLFLGTKKQAQPLIKEAAESIGAPYINYRWVGGLLTNFDEIRKNVKKLQGLAEKKEKGELSRYTKKEQLLISRKLEKFDREWGGMSLMEVLPDALFIIDCMAEKTAVAECLRMNIPTIAIVDTNCDPHPITHPIPGNDDATKAIKMLTDTIAYAYGEGLKQNQKSKVKVQKEKEEKEAADLLKESETIKADVEAAEEELEEKAVEDASRQV